MNRPRVAVVGGGIFGVSSALELGAFCDVTLYERRNGIMGEGTYGNQYRHHYGYHYPRSPETVAQCKTAEEDFIAVWGRSLTRNFPAYYAVAQKGSRVSPDEFISFCDRNGLAYAIECPPDEFLNRDAVGVCIRTNEPVYSYDTLKGIGTERLASHPAITVKLGHRVAAGRIDQRTGRKIFTLITQRGTNEESFDYAVNAMYANHNSFCRWFGFPAPTLEFRLKEIVVVKLPVDKPLAVTVMDGPFATLVPTSTPGIFTFGDVGRSIHEVRFGSGELPWTAEEMNGFRTRFPDMQAHAPALMPILARAEYVRSMFSVLPIMPNSDATDTRLTAVTSHGSGCWSVFEGKIVTCVRAAKQVAGEIRQSLEG